MPALTPERVQYINAHGTSTPLGDKNETDAIKAAFGAHAKIAGGELDQVDDRPPARRRGRHRVGLHGAGDASPICPPTINLTDPDPDCDLDYCANSARDLKLETAVKNNFGFGGTNGTLVFTKV